MTKTCSVAGCNTNHKKKINGKSFISNPGTVFIFPDESRKPQLYKKWVRFCNQKTVFKTSMNNGICSKHFDAAFIKTGTRKTLRWDIDPFPSNYCVDVPPSMIPTPSPPPRKPPTDRSVQTDPLKEFQNDDQIKTLADITTSACPPGYKLELHDGKAAIFYKMEYSVPNVPEVTETIVIDAQLHVKLYKKSIPIPLPEWFRKGGDCRVKCKSIIENFPSHIKNYGDMDTPDVESIPRDIMDELQQIKYKKPVDGPKFSANLLRYSLLLYYTSPQAYKMLMEQFPFPSISLLKKLSKGGVEPLKVCKVLLEQGKIDKDVVLTLDEIYLQKEAQYNGGRMIGADADGNMFKGVMTFMINSLKKSIPVVVKAVPEMELNGKWIAEQIDELISALHKCGFNVRAVISDNHSTNVSAFGSLLKSYGMKDSPDTIIHPSRKNGKIYLFYDSVHLLKNIRNNLLNARRFDFPSFSFHDFYDDIDVPSGKISWKLLHDVYDRDEQLAGYLRKAPKLSYKSLHPGDNKQSVPLALNIFDRSTAVAITEYFPESNDASEFVKLINIWWTISNSKQETNHNFRLGNAAVLGDNKPEFLRDFADWIEKWQQLESSKSKPHTLTPQTAQALVTTLRCTASLIEDLLQEGYSYVLTARFQTDPLERRFSRYRQMSGGRFLIGLRELECSERIIAITTLLKESIDFWKDDVRPDEDQSASVLWLNSELDKISDDIDA